MNEMIRRLSLFVAVGGGCLTVLHFAGCSSPTTSLHRKVPAALESLMQQEFPIDGRLYSQNSGKIIINPDTPICTASDGAGLFSIESGDFLAPLGQKAVINGSDRQVPEDDQHCDHPNALHLRGVSIVGTRGQVQKLVLAAWQSDAFWLGAIRREDGDFGEFTEMQWLPLKERSRRSFRRDVQRIGYALGAFIAENKGR